MVLWRQFWNSNLSNSGKSGHLNRSQTVTRLVFLEIKALDDEQNSLSTGASWLAVLPWAAKKPLLITSFKCHERFCLFFFTYPWIFNTGNLPQIYRPQTLTQFPAIKRSSISGDISLIPGPLTRSQSAKSKDISDRLYPTLDGELSSSKCLKIGHWNINGLLGKIHEDKVFLLTLKFPVLAITESHLRCRTKDADNLYSWLQNR